MSAAGKEVLRTSEEIEPDWLECPVYLLQERVDQLNTDEPPDVPVKYWKTVEGVWFTRAEAEEWAGAHSYRMGEWRCYAVPARGALKLLLKQRTQDEVVPSVSSVVKK